MRKGFVSGLIIVTIICFCYFSVYAETLRCFRVFYSTTSKQYIANNSIIIYGWERTDTYWTAPTSDTYYFVVTAVKGTLQSHYSREVYKSCTQGEVVHLVWNYSRRIQSSIEMHNVWLEYCEKTVARKSGSGSVSMKMTSYPGDPDKIILGVSDSIVLDDGDEIYSSRF